MVSWRERPVELANLLNPAFCALLLRDTARDYARQAANGLPLPLLYLVLPTVLHKPTRQALPATTAALLHGWLQSNPAVQMRVAYHSRRLVPYTREALIFGLQHGALAVATDGGIQSAMDKVPKTFPAGSEMDSCRKAAAFVGRWFAKAGKPDLVLAMWGLQP